MENCKNVDTERKYSLTTYFICFTPKFLIYINICNTFSAFSIISIIVMFCLDSQLLMSAVTWHVTCLLTFSQNHNVSAYFFHHNIIWKTFLCYMNVISGRQTAPAVSPQQLAAALRVQSLRHQTSRPNVWQRWIKFTFPLSGAGPELWWLHLKLQHCSNSQNFI